MYLFDSLKEIAEKYLSEQQLEALRQAYLVARDAHEGQKRSSGEPYITHPVAVSRILAEMHMDHETLMAALLHDVIEDTEVTKIDLSQRFGENVAELVDGVSKLDKLKFRDKAEAQAENFRKMIMAMAKDIRVILIKLADRTHNMRTLGALRPDKRRRIAKETLEIYAPLAHRLGIHSIKIELEDLGFQALYPTRYRVLKQVVHHASGNRIEIVQKLQTEILDRLNEAHIQANVLGREKNLYSIYEKMRHKEQRFDSIMDLYAFRIIVDDLDTCYRVLGQVHNLYKPRPGRMKDYIAVPKANGYQSLHSSLIGPRGVPIEVQIRTESMNQMADKGVAAHWAYKDGKINKSTSTTTLVRAQRWMESLLELQQNTGSSQEFIEGVKSDLFPDEIFVFTPRGRIVELPAGATTVDFAYAVHTDIGNSCISVRVDDEEHYSLSEPLKNGQTIEVITAPGAQPNATWLNFVVTSRARTKIRQVLKTKRRDESIKLGKRLLNHALGLHKFKEIAPDKIQHVLQDLKLTSLDDLFAELGTGELVSLVIAKRLLDDIDIIATSSHLSLNKTESSLLTYAKCCLPIHGDNIIAHISPEKGLVVHREECANIRGYRQEPDKYMAAEWGDSTDQEFTTALKIEILTHQDALADLTKTIATTGSNILSLRTEERDGRLYCVHVKITSQNRTHLANIMRRIRVLPHVVKVIRQLNQ